MPSYFLGKQANGWLTCGRGRAGTSKSLRHEIWRSIPSGGRSPTCQVEAVLAKMGGNGNRLESQNIYPECSVTYTFKHNTSHWVRKTFVVLTHGSEDKSMAFFSTSYCNFRSVLPHCLAERSGPATRGRAFTGSSRGRAASLSPAIVLIGEERNGYMTAAGESGRQTVERVKYTVKASSRTS